MIRARPHDWGLKLLLKFLRGLLAGRHGDLSYRCKYSAVFIIVQNLILLVVRIHYRNRTGDVGLSEFTLSVLLTLMIVAGLRCPLVGFLLPLHGVIDLWVLLCKVG